ncbi:MAG TPA: hypothetical protein DCL08_08855 [Anaerolineaceae bacterium]|nr:hypothetical protein [Anaerolineaceae bacterium]
MSTSKRLETAREAFERRDEASSAKVHDPEAIAQAAVESHGRASDQYIGNMVYGGLDGIITTFAVVSGVAGAELGAGVIVILGLANLLGDGLSMAVGAYLSSRSEQEYYEKERAREAWEVDHFPEGERAEMIEIYQGQGYSEEEAQKLVEIISRDKERWLDSMMVDELGMLADEKKPILSALATLASFIVAGSVPLLIYFLGLITPLNPALSFPISLALSGLALFGLGAAKVFITERNFLKSGLEMLIVGGLSASVAYLVGVLLKGVGG